jgi:putative DNA primase/helicase
VCGPSLNTLGGEFGLAPLIGKQLAIIADSRLGAKTDRALVVERLLSISGEDALDVRRMYKPHWNGQLDCRLIIFANELLSTGDSAGAILARSVNINLTQSFLGREDRRLGEKLRAEMTGILNWALEGLAKLRQVGEIRSPASAQSLTNEMARLSNPVLAFAEDCCEFGPGRSVTKDDLWCAYKLWHIQNGLHSSPWSKEVFGRAVKTGLGGRVRDVRNTTDPGVRVRSWDGVGLNGTVTQASIRTLH